MYSDAIVLSNPARLKQCLFFFYWFTFYGDVYEVDMFVHTPSPIMGVLRVIG